MDVLEANGYVRLGRLKQDPIRIGLRTERLGRSRRRVRSQGNGVDVTGTCGGGPPTRSKHAIPFRPNTTLVVDAANDRQRFHRGRISTRQIPPRTEVTSATYCLPSRLIHWIIRALRGDVMDPATEPLCSAT